MDTQQLTAIIKMREATTVAMQIARAMTECRVIGLYASDYNMMTGQTGVKCVRYVCPTGMMRLSGGNQAVVFSDFQTNQGFLITLEHESLVR